MEPGVTNPDLESFGGRKISVRLCPFRSAKRLRRTRERTGCAGLGGHQSGNPIGTGRGGA